MMGYLYAICYDRFLTTEISKQKQRAHFYRRDKNKNFVTEYFSRLGYVSFIKLKYSFCLILITIGDLWFVKFINPNSNKLSNSIALQKDDAFNFRLSELATSSRYSQHTNYLKESSFPCCLYIFFYFLSSSKFEECSLYREYLIDRVMERL
jgi:hypothetical protein